MNDVIRQKIEEAVHIAGIKGRIVGLDKSVALLIHEDLLDGMVLGLK